jgi:uncharacterized protein with FMN-binding domain
MNPRPHPSLARRALPALVLTGASGFLLSALDHPGNAVSALGSGTKSAGGATPTTISGGTPATEPSGQAPAASAPGQSAPAATNAPAQNAPAGSTGTKTTTAPKSTVPAAPGACTTKTGPVVNTRFGPVQVQASVSPDGTKICSVNAIQSPNDRRRSVLINQQAVPMLNDQVMQAQSANIDGVSGATITSNGYARSLQALLDGLH